MDPYTSLFVAAIVVTLAIYLRRTIFPETIPGIHTFRGCDTLLGDLPRVVRELTTTGNLSCFLDETVRQLGVISQIRLGPLGRIVILTDYQEITNLLTHRSKSFERSHQVINCFRTIVPEAQISLKTHEKFKLHRKIVGTAMGARYLSVATPRAAETVEALIAVWRVKGIKAGGRGWGVKMDLSGVALDAMCGMAFGHSAGIMTEFKDQAVKGTPAISDDPTEVVFQHTWPTLARDIWYLVDSIPINSISPTISHFFHSLTPALRKHHRNYSHFMDAKIQAARRRASEIGLEGGSKIADNTLDVMMSREWLSGDHMSDDAIKQEILQYLVAGTESTSVALSWFLKFMTNNPDVQVKLRESIRSALPEIQDRHPRYEELNSVNLPYLEAVVHEVLRLGRIAPGFTRDTVEDVIIMGHHIPAGTTILMPTLIGLEDASTPVWAAPPISPDNKQSSESSPFHTIQISKGMDYQRSDTSPRRVGFWEAGTGSMFKPERWLDGNGRFNPDAGPSLPFSLGPRACFGKNLAMSELRLFFTMLNQAFFFDRVEDARNSYESHETFVNYPKHMSIRPRDWSDQGEDS